MTFFIQSFFVREDSGRVENPTRRMLRFQTGRGKPCPYPNENVLEAGIVAVGIDDNVTINLVHDIEGNRGVEKFLHIAAKGHFARGLTLGTVHDLVGDCSGVGIDHLTGEQDSAKSGEGLAGDNDFAVGSGGIGVDVGNLEGGSGIAGVEGEDFGSQSIGIMATGEAETFLRWVLLVVSVTSRIKSPPSVPPEPWVRVRVAPDLVTVSL